MEWLNYHHLRYFHLTAKEGSVTAAARKLRLAQPTVSGQLRQLEDALGGKLFVRAGRNLVLSDLGRVVFRYADEIFSLGSELVAATRGKEGASALRLVLGASAALPKLAVYQFVAPALALGEPVQVVCKEDRFDNLMASLSVHAIDLVLSDRPMGPEVSIKAYNHLLGDSSVTFFAEKRVADGLRRGFPRSLDGAPFLLPGDDTVLRSSLENWFERLGIRPHRAGEIQDSALMKVFGQAGTGVFAVPSVVEREVRRQYRVSTVGRTDDIRERFYAITVERRIRHPGVVAICQRAKELLAA